MVISEMGVIGTSKKEDKRRVPIHPEHLIRLPESIRKKLIFEKMDLSISSTVQSSNSNLDLMTIDQSNHTATFCISQTWEWN